MASTEEIAMEYYNKGVHSLVSNDIENGIENMKMAETIFEEISDQTNYIKTLRCLCIGYSMIGANSQMIQVLLKGINYCDKNKIRGAKHLFYTNICNKYMTLDDYDSAINYGLMAVQDFESNGEFFENSFSTYLVGYLNLAYSYMKTRRFKEAELYIIKARTIADKNDLHSHDFSLDVITAYLHNASGDQEYVLEHKNDLMNFIKSINITIEDFIQDITILVELLCSMELFDDAETVAKNVEYSAISNCNNKMKLETSKLFMYIYKHSKDLAKYNDACVKYAEDDIALHKADAEKQLEDMDTAIALSIASSPLDFI